MQDKDDAPELTPALLAKAAPATANSRLMQSVRPGRPRSDNPKVPVSLRLDADIVAHFKAQGKGWQTRINEALHKAIAE